MAILERIGRLAAWPKQLLERRRKQIAELRRAVHPLISDVLAMVAEKAQIELESAVWEQAHDLAHGVQECGLAVGSKPHHLVLVAVVRKAEILRQRLIKDAERMRENRRGPTSRVRSPLPHPRRRSKNRQIHRPRRRPPDRKEKRGMPKRDARDDARRVEFPAELCHREGLFQKTGECPRVRGDFVTRLSTRLMSGRLDRK